MYDRELFGDIPGYNKIMSKIYPGWKNSTNVTIPNQQKGREKMKTAKTNKQQQQRRQHEDLTGEF